MLQALGADLKQIKISDDVGGNIRYGLKVIATDPFTISDVNASGLSFDDSGYSGGPTTACKRADRARGLEASTV